MIKVKKEGIMFKNYITITWRNLVRNKINSSINIIGFAIGIACTILILLWVTDELSYDQYHEKADRIHRVTMKSTNTNIQFARIGSAWAPVLQNEFPEIINTVRFYKEQPNIKYENKSFDEERFFFTDASVFDIFSFPLVKGNPQTALQEPFSIVITEEMAAKYFDNEDAIGKILSVNIDEDHCLDFQITGILKNIPRNSHFKFDFLSSFESLKKLYPKDLSNNWW